MPGRQIFSRLGVVPSFEGTCSSVDSARSLVEHEAYHWHKERRIWIAINA